MRSPWVNQQGEEFALHPDPINFLAPPERIDYTSKSYLALMPRYNDALFRSPNIQRLRFQ